MKHLVKHQVMVFTDHRKQPHWCWVDVLQTEEFQTFIVFSEPENWPGRSLTNVIEHAIFAYHFWADVFNWPEPSEGVRYVENDDDGEASWSFVTLDSRAQNPSWRHVPDDLAWQLLEAIQGEERVWTV